MREIAFHNDAGTWVRLIFDGATIALDRWPGPHLPDSMIHASGGGRFVLDYLDDSATGGLAAVYTWSPPR